PLFKKLPYECWGFVAKDKSETLVTYVCIMGVPNIHSRRIRLKGLDENAFYKNEETGEVFSGAVLMNAGININVNHDFEAKLFHFVRV
ncbi:MAG: GH36 C-terminal domain-containing protein, partial [Oscillospiraceae bacterium]|nr:GH36 C-terminal domain-containing protein [Oscillospiraceae bacterium]